VPNLKIKIERIAALIINDLQDYFVWCISSVDQLWSTTLENKIICRHNQECRHDTNLDSIIRIFDDGNFKIPIRFEKNGTKTIAPVTLKFF